MLVHLNQTYITLSEDEPTVAIPVSPKGFICRVTATKATGSDDAKLYILDTQPSEETNLVLRSIIPSQTINDSGVVHLPAGLGAPFVTRSGYVYAHIKLSEGGEGTYSVGICWRTNDS